MTCFVGIDPGFSGGIGIIRSDGSASVEAMPTLKFVVDTKTKSGKKSRTELDAVALKRVLTDVLAVEPEVFVMVEKPQMRPATRKTSTGDVEVNQGLSSAARFVAQGEFIRGLLVGLDVPHQFVHPATWKRDVFRGAGGDDKDAARMKAQQMFPRIADSFRLKKHDGVAEAILLADYAKRRRTP